MNAELILYRATEADIADIMGVERLCFTRPWGYVSFFAELCAENGYNYMAREKSGTAGNAVAGYLFFRIAAGEMEILRIAVSPVWRRHGLARQILGRGLQKALETGATASFLEVRASNIPAIGLYTGMGFERIGHRPGYYPETGEDALILMKNLKEGV